MPPVRATRGRRRTLGAAAALALIGCLATSCGEESGTGLSEERASTLRSALDGVEARVARSDCAGATEQAGAFRGEVESLPARVDGELRDALEGSAARLESLVAQQCEAEEAPAPAPDAPDETSGDQRSGPKKEKKPKQEKPQKPEDEQRPPDTGATGQEGSTGATGPSGGAAAPEGG